MKYTRVHRNVMLLPHFCIMATQSSTKLCVSRHGIVLDTLGSLSVNPPFLMVSINFSRLMYWLRIGIHINSFIFSQLPLNKRTFLFPQTYQESRK